MDIAGMGTRAEMYEMAGKLVEVNGKDCFEMVGDIGQEMRFPVCWGKIFWSRWQD